MNTKLSHLKCQIQRHQHKLYRPPLEVPYTQCGKNQYVQLYEDGGIMNNHNLQFTKVEDNDANMITAQKILLEPTPLQCAILKNWCYAYYRMYNLTLRFIKTEYSENKKVTLNFKKLRTCFLKKQRDDIIQESKERVTNPSLHVKTHMLDKAIQLACANYKSALTNLRNGNIKHFRIRYWRPSRKAYRLDIEQQYFRKDGICPSLLGCMKATTEDGDVVDFSNVQHDCQLIYDKHNGRFCLYVPFTREKESISNRKKWISLDPGSRKFMTGLSTNEVVKIGEDMDKKLWYLLHRKDRMGKKTWLSQEQRKKLQDKLQSKIERIRDDLHWQVISYLTKNYDTILIGDLSAKRVSNRETSCLLKRNKRILYALSFYKFRQRLIYKGELRKCNVQVIDEAYSSKTCSHCGHVKQDLGSNSIYTCNHCNMVIDRDVNGARCIAMIAHV